MSATLRSLIQSKQTIQFWACAGMHELTEVHESKAVPQWDHCLRGALDAVSHDRIAIWWNTECDIHESHMEKTGHPWEKTYAYKIYLFPECDIENVEWETRWYLRRTMYIGIESLNGLSWI